MTRKQYTAKMKQERLSDDVIRGRLRGWDHFGEVMKRSKELKR